LNRGLVGLIDNIHRGTGLDETEGGVLASLSCCQVQGRVFLPILDV
jgi:hypothetical protein